MFGTEPVCFLLQVGSLMLMGLKRVASVATSP